MNRVLVCTALAMALACTEKEKLPTPDARNVYVYQVLDFAPPSGARDYATDVVAVIDNSISVPLDVEARFALMVVPEIALGIHTLEIKKSNDVLVKQQLNVIKPDDAELQGVLPRIHALRVSELNDLQASAENLPVGARRDALLADVNAIRTALPPVEAFDQLPTETRNKLRQVLYANETALRRRADTLKQPLSTAVCGDRWPETGFECIADNFWLRLTTLRTKAKILAVVGGVLGALVGGVPGALVGASIGAFVGAPAAVLELNNWLFDEVVVALDYFEMSLGLDAPRDLHPFDLLPNSPRSYPIAMHTQNLTNESLSRPFSVRQVFVAALVRFQQLWSEISASQSLQSAPYAFDDVVELKGRFTPRSHIAVAPTQQTRDGWTLSTSVTNGLLTATVTGSSDIRTVFDVLIVYDNPGVERQETTVSFTAVPREDDDGGVDAGSDAGIEDGGTDSGSYTQVAYIKSLTPGAVRFGQGALDLNFDGTVMLAGIPLGNQHLYLFNKDAGQWIASHTFTSQDAGPIWTGSSQAARLSGDGATVAYLTSEPAQEQSTAGRSDNTAYMYAKNDAGWHVKQRIARAIPITAPAGEAGCAGDYLLEQISLAIGFDGQLAMGAADYWQKNGSLSNPPTCSSQIFAGTILFYSPDGQENGSTSIPTQSAFTYLKMSADGTTFLRHQPNINDPNTWGSCLHSREGGTFVASGTCYFVDGGSLTPYALSGDGRTAVLAGDSKLEVYVQKQDAGWIQQTTLDNSGITAQMAVWSPGAITANGDILLAGLPSDSSSKGAACTYRRQTLTDGGVVWSGPACIHASNADTGDSFGTSVAISGNGRAIAVGAPYEASSGIGPNSPEVQDNSMPGSGAVYLFELQ